MIPGRSVYGSRCVPARALFFAIIVVSVFGWRWAYVTWQLRTARAALSRGEIELALRELQAAERFQPDRSEVLYLLGRAYRRDGRVELAASYLDRAEQAGWPIEDLHQQRRLGLLQIGHFAEGEPYLRSVLRQNASDELAEEVYEAHAKGLLYAHRFNEAVICLNFWADWRPRAVQPRFWRADVWFRMGMWRNAVDEYEAILRIDPEHLDSRRRLADALLNLNEVESALSHYERCLRVRPDDHDSRIGVASCCRRLGELARAESVLRGIPEREVSTIHRAHVLSELGQIALEQRETETARQLLEQAADLDPRNAVARHALGVACSRLGFDQQAASRFAEAEQIHRDFGRLTDVTRELLKTPGLAELRYEAGCILMKYGMQREGAGWMATALMYEPNHGPTHERLARYYAETGDHRLARKHQQMAAAAGQLDSTAASPGAMKPFFQIEDSDHE